MEKVIDFETDGTQEEGNDQGKEQDEGITKEVMDQNKMIVEAQNTFADVPSHIDSKKIPKAFQRAFNKILEHEYDGITYRYKELDFMDLLAHGQNPYSLELMRLAGGVPDRDPDKVMQTFESIPIERKLELAQTESIRRKNLLKDSLIDMSCDGATLPIDVQIINAMTPDIIEELFKVITREGEGEAEAVARFHQVYGSKIGNTDLSDE